MSVLQLSDTETTATILSVVDPRDGTSVGDVDVSSAEDAERALLSADDAFGSWARVAPAERGSAMHTAADALEREARALAAINTRETGRSEAEALDGILAGVSTLRQYAELGPLHRGKSLKGSVLSADFTVSEPRGVVVALTPWNDPVAVACGLIGAAVVTGNTVVHKPSERSPHTGLRLGDILREAFPDNVLQTVNGGPQVGSFLTSSRIARVICHVGSTETGRLIARAAAETGAHVVLENGGNDPLIVDRCVDARWAARQAAVGAFTNAGQLCTSVERIYVDDQIERQFTSALVAEAEQWQRRLGPLVDRRLRAVVHRHVEDAVERGATVEIGGRVPAGPGSHYPATVLTACSSEMLVMREETFGPIAPIQAVASFDEALRLAGASRYGLSATVLTDSLENAHRAIAELGVGTLKVNAVFGGAPGGSAQPRRESGQGFGYGPELLDEMTMTKVVHLQAAEALA